MITPAMERYLAAIFRLQQMTPELTISDLAHHLDVSLPAVSTMIQRLEKQRLVERTQERGLTLSAEGQQRAMPIIRRYLLAEVFLNDVMRFAWEEAHTLAYTLFQGVNQTIEDRIDELTGSPAFTRRGEPIPTRDGVLPIIEDVALGELQPGEQGTISRIQISDPDRLRYLSELGLLPQKPVELVSAAPFEGPITLRCAGQDCVISFEMAGCIRVRR
ncbi:MAG: metal-dependent transcriptional regulator [Chloroflexi bacterium]|nr:metal-dependent transcriptional regulator [Chloroflexota bacterium]